MTYEELKTRIKEKGLDKHVFILFDIKYGPEFSTCVYKEPDGTYSCIGYGERGSIDFEKRNKPEEEICEMVYEYAISQTRFEVAFQERLRQIHK